MFSVTQNGKPLSSDKYNWDEKTKTFSSTEDDLVIDFGDNSGITFKTGAYCIFYTGSNCTFNTGSNCTFNTGSNCIFNTGYYCTFKTGSNCTFKTGAYCTFKTGYSCTFKTGHNCTFDTGENCVAIRCDVKGVTEIPENKTIKFNGNRIAGYTEVKEVKEVPSCNGKVVEIDGKKYQLKEID